MISKWLIALCILALSMFGAAEARIVAPIPEHFDLNEGTYPVSFEQDEMEGDSIIDAHIYTEDRYDIGDIDALTVGDAIVIGGQTIGVNAINRDSWVEINGGYAEIDGYDLVSREGDNFYKVLLEDDYISCTDYGAFMLPLAEDVTFTDCWQCWDIDVQPAVYTGREAVMKAIRESENDSFFESNTTFRLEHGCVVEINRQFLP